MVRLKLLGVGVALAMLSGCFATGMSQTECVAADWSALGYADGRNGRSAGRFVTRADQCIQYGVFADQSVYDAGYQRGLEALCTPLGGLEFGRAGRSYQGVCAPDMEYAFMQAYDAGVRFHRLHSAMHGAESALDSAYSRIDRLQRDRREKIRKLNESPDEPYRKKKRDQIAAIESSLYSVEQSLHRLRHDVRHAERAFFRYEAQFLGYERALRQAMAEGAPPPPAPY